MMVSVILNPPRSRLPDDVGPGEQDLRHERDAKQTLYMAQIGAKLACEWFQNPVPNIPSTNMNSVDFLPTRGQLSSTRSSGSPTRGIERIGRRGELHSRSPLPSLREGHVPRQRGDPDIYVTPTRRGRTTSSIRSTRPSASGSTRRTTSRAGAPLGGHPDHRPPGLRPAAPQQLRFGIAVIRSTATKFDTRFDGSGNPIGIGRRSRRGRST